MEANTDPQPLLNTRYDRGRRRDHFQERKKQLGMAVFKLESVRVDFNRFTGFHPEDRRDSPMEQSVVVERSLLTPVLGTCQP